MACFVREDGRIETWGITNPTPLNYGQIEVVEATAYDQAIRERDDARAECERLGEALGEAAVDLHGASEMLERRDGHPHNTLKDEAKRYAALASEPKLSQGSNDK